MPAIKHSGVYSDNSVTAYLKVKSEELGNQNGQFTLLLKLYASDTTFLETTPLFSVNNYFTIQLTNGFGNTYLLPGDSTEATFSFTYDEENLPFYPKEVKFYALTNPTYSQSDTFYRYVKTRLKVYFTPYGTTEIWDIRDFACTVLLVEN